jgi:hypothetical protein
MLPATLQFLITMIACAINERMQRKLDYTQEEVRVLKEIVAVLTAVLEGVHRDSQSSGRDERENSGAKPQLQSIRGALCKKHQVRVSQLLRNLR